MTGCLHGDIPSCILLSNHFPRPVNRQLHSLCFGDFHHFFLCLCDSFFTGYTTRDKRDRQIVIIAAKIEPEIHSVVAELGTKCYIHDMHTMQCTCACACACTCRCRYTMLHVIRSQVLLYDNRYGQVGTGSTTLQAPIY